MKFHEKPAHYIKHITLHVKKAPSSALFILSLQIRVDAMLHKL